MTKTSAGKSVTPSDPKLRRTVLVGILGRRGKADVVHGPFETDADSWMNQALVLLGPYCEVYPKSRTQYS